VARPNRSDYTPDAAVAADWGNCLSGRATAEADWWSLTGSDAYLDWVADTNAEYTTYTADMSSEYTNLVARTIAADTNYVTQSSQEEADAKRVQAKTNSDTAEQLAGSRADHKVENSAADLALVISGNQTTHDTAAAAAEQKFQTTTTAAVGQGDTDNAETDQDYVDAVYGDGGDYDTWQDAVDGAINDFSAAQAAASETFSTNLSAHDAALATTLADSYAAALEAFAQTNSTPGPPEPPMKPGPSRTRSRPSKLPSRPLIRPLPPLKAEYAERLPPMRNKTRSEAKADALQTHEQAKANAKVTAVAGQAAVNNTAAAAGAGMQKAPEAGTPPEEPEDVNSEGESILQYELLFGDQLYQNADFAMAVLVKEMRDRFGLGTLTDGNRQLSLGILGFSGSVPLASSRQLEYKIQAKFAEKLKQPLGNLKFREFRIVRPDDPHQPESLFDLGDIGSNLYGAQDFGPTADQVGGFFIQAVQEALRETYAPKFEYNSQFRDDVESFVKKYSRELKVIGVTAGLAYAASGRGFKSDLERYLYAKDVGEYLQNLGIKDVSLYSWDMNLAQQYNKIANKFGLKPLSGRTKLTTGVDFKIDIERGFAYFPFGQLSFEHVMEDGLLGRGVLFGSLDLGPYVRVVPVDTRFEPFDLQLGLPESKPIIKIGVGVEK
jgi:hypothetical protein